jgi:hypothetical protein
MEMGHPISTPVADNIWANTQIYYILRNLIQSKEMAHQTSKPQSVIVRCNGSFYLEKSCKWLARLT